MSYIDMIKERARLDKKTIVLPESNDKRTLLAAARIVEEGIADIIMIGDEEKISCPQSVSFYTNFSFSCSVNLCFDEEICMCGAGSAVSC